MPLAASWQPKCKQMLSMMGKMFGTDKPIFWNDVSPKVLPDYYTVRLQGPLVPQLCPLTPLASLRTCRW